MQTECAISHSATARPAVGELIRDRQHIPSLSSVSPPCIRSAGIENAITDRATNAFNSRSQPDNFGIRDSLADD